MMCKPALKCAEGACYFKECDCESFYERALKCGQLSWNIYVYNSFLKAEYIKIIVIWRIRMFLTARKWRLTLDHSDWEWFGKTFI